MTLLHLCLLLKATVAASEAWLMGPSRSTYSHDFDDSIDSNDSSDSGREEIASQTLQSSSCFRFQPECSKGSCEKVVHLE